LHARGSAAQEAIMECVTVRRWVGLPPEEIFRRLCDLDELVAGDPSLELLEPPYDPGQLHPGDRAVVLHQRGRRVTRLHVDVVSARAPEVLVARISTRAATWLLEVDITPLDGELSDLELRARLDDSTRSGSGRSAAGRRSTEGIEALLEGLAHHVGRAAVPA
jgi:hypothetical protein